MSRAVTILAAGRTALADSGNTGLRAVTITRIAIGSGLKPASANDDARAALRTQRDAAAVTGVPAVAGDVAVRADIAPTASYSVTEVGVFARIGAAGAEFLFAYWAAADVASAWAAAATGGAKITVAAVVRVAGSAAAVNVAPALNLSIAAVGAATEERAGKLKLSTQALADAGVDDETAMTPALVKRRIDAQQVTRLSVTRDADTVDIRSGTTTQLGSLDLTKTGYWLLQLSVRIRMRTRLGANIRVRIDGVIVELVTLISLAGSSRFIERGGGDWCVVRNKNSGDRVTADGYVGNTHQYSAMTFEAFYLGPSA